MGYALVERPDGQESTMKTECVPYLAFEEPICGKTPQSTLCAKRGKNKSEKCMIDDYESEAMTTGKCSL